MKRIAVVTAVIALLLLSDGTYLQLSNNQVGGDSGILFGDANIFLSAGTVVLICGGLTLAGAALMWVVALRHQGRLASGGQVSQSPGAGARAKVAAHPQAREGQEHQRQA